MKKFNAGIAIAGMWTGGGYILSILPDDAAIMALKIITLIMIIILTPIIALMLGSK